eukprot:TRINITY_DN330_c0_g1_i6.p1 TRINITY_DN330_c0_g1~~TRINITY_DN330_c0_g1_i6.p1  ORF type:complete len:156 (-),score=33.68 TRINITY_DN330_c0_g1_i6:539-1006(-)
MILEDSQIAEVVCQIWIDKPSESTSYCRAVLAALNEHLRILNRPLIATKDTAHFSTSYPKLLNAWKNIQKTQKKRTHEPAKARVITLVSSRAIWQVFNPYDAEELRDMVIFDGLTTLDNLGQTACGSKTSSDEGCVDQRRRICGGSLWFYLFASS